MNVKALIAHLQTFDENLEVMIDGHKSGVGNFPKANVTQAKVYNNIHSAKRDTETLLNRSLWFTPDIRDECTEARAKIPKLDIVYISRFNTEDDNNEDPEKGFTSNGYSGVHELVRLGEY